MVHRFLQSIARNFLFHPVGFLPAECSGSEGVRFPFRDFQEKVEVIGHQTLSDHSHPREGLLVAQDLAEDLLVLGFEDHSPVHDPGHDVVKGTAFAEES